MRSCSRNLTSYPKFATRKASSVLTSVFVLSTRSSHIHPQHRVGTRSAAMSAAFELYVFAASVGTDLDIHVPPRTRGCRHRTKDLCKKGPSNHRRDARPTELTSHSPSHPYLTTSLSIPHPSLQLSVSPLSLIFDLVRYCIIAILYTTNLDFKYRRNADEHCRATHHCHPFRMQPSSLEKVETEGVTYRWSLKYIVVAR